MRTNGSEKSSRGRRTSDVSGVAACALIAGNGLDPGESGQSSHCGRLLSAALQLYVATTGHCGRWPRWAACSLHGTAPHDLIVIGLQSVLFVRWVHKMADCQHSNFGCPSFWPFTAISMDLRRQVNRFAGDKMTKGTFRRLAMCWRPSCQTSAAT